NIFTFNFLLDWAEGIHGMNWNDGSSFFFARVPQGDYWTLDPAKCPLTIERNDKTERQIEATFTAIAEQGGTTQTVTVTEGVLKVAY
ncbi:MAG: hypothetical protein R3330_10910, partial [Saprospiraceae bacterium]|nr:hypothetical protein [Saprospiraceae bacterium]